MKGSSITMTEEGKTGQEQCEFDADLFFFNQEGIVHKEFVLAGQTVNAYFYCEVLRWFHEVVRRKRPAKWCNNWLLHHDNMPAHTVLKVQQFLATT